MLEQEHPSAIYNVLESLCRLRTNGLYEIDALIRNYITRMCNIVLPYQSPWANIWRLMGKFDSDV